MELAATAQLLQLLQLQQPLQSPVKQMTGLAFPSQMRNISPTPVLAPSSTAHGRRAAKTLLDCRPPSLLWCPRPTCWSAKPQQQFRWPPHKRWQSGAVSSPSLLRSPWPAVGCEPCQLQELYAGRLAPPGPPAEHGARRSRETEHSHVATPAHKSSASRRSRADCTRFLH